MTTLLKILELKDLYELGARMRYQSSLRCVREFRRIPCFYLPFHFGKSFCWNMHIPFACKCNSSNGIVHIKHILLLLEKASKAVNVTLQFVSPTAPNTYRLNHHIARVGPISIQEHSNISIWCIKFFKPNEKHMIRL